jgi:preprotein translocase subunit SecA
VEEEEPEPEPVPAEVEELSHIFQGAGPAPVIHAKGLEERPAPADLTYSAPSETGDNAVVTAQPEGSEDGDAFGAVGRNDLCPCGSGKKYKRCHGAPGGPTGQTSRVG